MEMETQLECQLEFRREVKDMNCQTVLEERTGKDLKENTLAEKLRGRTCNVGNFGG
jgi:hypothetical protein